MKLLVVFTTRFATELVDLILKADTFRETYCTSVLRYIKITSSHSRNAPMASAPLHLFSLHMTSLTISQEAVLGTYLYTSCFLMQNIDVNLYKI